MAHRILFHAVPQHRLASILANGLLPECSRGKRSEVWLGSASRRPWQVRHTSRRHQVEAGRVVLIRVLVDRSQLTRRGRGLWTCPVAIPPSSIVSVTLPAARAAAVASV